MSNEKDKIEKTLRYAASKNLSAIELGRLLTQKHDITPVEATQWMDEYCNRFSNALKKPPQPRSSRINAIPVGPVMQVAAIVTSNPPEISSESNYQPSILNRSAVKSFALAASEQNRAGKFKRCSPDFIQAVEAEVEALLRQIGGSEPEQDVPGEYSFINCKRAFPKIEEQLNRLVRKTVLRRVKSQPSNGQTLK
jgi:hypothetical protein